MIYRLLFSLLLRRLPAETAHLLAGAILRGLTAVPGLRRQMRRVLDTDDPRLRVDALGLSLPSPLGVAAGMDKDATLFEGLGALGFGFVEVGTVTALPQRGSPRPRLFRLAKDRALLNSMGFPNPGAEAVAERLRGRSCQTVLGVSLGRSAVVPADSAAADYRASARQLAPLADFVVLNVSSPNTAGLRSLQAADPLRTLVGEVNAELRAIDCPRPILMKIGPDLSDEELDVIADLALELELDGIVAVNTTVARQGLRETDAEALARPGGISGAPLKPRALEVLRRLRARIDDRLVLVSVGGIESAEDAWQRILAGATLVQAYTGFVYGGPLWPRRVNRGLAERIDASGASSIAELVGTSGGGKTVSSDRPTDRV